MPRKFGVNEKAQEARDREEDRKQQAKSTKAKQQEDAKWVETDKDILRKASRKEDKEAKEREAIAKKAEKDALRRAEEADLAKNQPPKKLTQFMLQTELTRHNQPARPVVAPNMRNFVSEEEQIASMPLENTNRQRMEQAEDGGHVHASGIDSVVSAMDDVKIGTGGDLDMHPEKRMKAAYAAYLDRMLPVLKREIPGLRLSQYKQMIFDRWQKAPENPKLQAAMQSGGGV
eukprot:PhF_6_TR3711/c1_g1_i1/m.5301